MTETQVLADRVAIVTGGGRGLGRAIAGALAERGARVVLVGRTEATLKEAANEIGSFGGTASWFCGDVSAPETVDGAVRHALEQYGSIDILVNNAQEIAIGTLLELDRESFERSWQSGPMAALALMRACHQHLRGGGVVINLLSSAGIRWDMQTYGAYGAAKQALAAISRTAACEWGPDGIRVVGVIPVAGTDAWTSYESAYPKEATEFVSRIPLQHMADPPVIGRVVAFLCGPDAAYMTGSVVNVDGGLAR